MSAALTGEFRKEPAETNELRKFYSTIKWNKRRLAEPSNAAKLYPRLEWRFRCALTQLNLMKLSIFQMARSSTSRAAWKPKEEEILMRFESRERAETETLTF